MYLRRETEINEQHKINTTLTVTTHITYETAVHRLAGVHSHEIDHMQFSQPALNEQHSTQHHPLIR